MKVKQHSKEILHLTKSHNKKKHTHIKTLERSHESDFFLTSTCHEKKNNHTVTACPPHHWTDRRGEKTNQTNPHLLILYNRFLICQKKPNKKHWWHQRCSNLLSHVVTSFSCRVWRKFVKGTKHRTFFSQSCPYLPTVMWKRDNHFVSNLGLFLYSCISKWDASF